MGKRKARQIIPIYARIWIGSISVDIGAKGDYLGSALGRRVKTRVKKAKPSNDILDYVYSKIKTVYK